MSFYSKKQAWKVLLLSFALIIGGLSLLFTNKLIDDLALEERKKVELWAEGMRQLVILSNPDQDVSFIFQVIKNNETVPVIVTDKEDNIIFFRNLDSLNIDKKEYLQKELREMKSQNPPIELNISDDDSQYIYYKDSLLLTRLFYYPYIQLLVIFVFIFVAYLSFSSFRRAEQNQVWIGMAKETAHQLGTPISSLLAWIELLKLSGHKSDIVNEVNKDIQRLEIIANRFSKIGSAPILQKNNLYTALNNILEYLKLRTSSHIGYSISSKIDNIEVAYNPDLFEWVIENICKNAIDAMNGAGRIDIVLNEKGRFYTIDIKDTGKGIPKSKFKTIFKPGYTTKKRGWGLGLTLAKRIIEDYHKGKIFVKSSDSNNGTVFRIMLQK